MVLWKGADIYSRGWEDGRGMTGIRQSFPRWSAGSGPLTKNRPVVSPGDEQRLEKQLHPTLERFIPFISLPWFPKHCFFCGTHSLHFPRLRKHQPRCCHREQRNIEAANNPPGLVPKKMPALSKAIFQPACPQDLLADFCPGYSRLL